MPFNPFQGLMNGSGNLMPSQQVEESINDLYHGGSEVSASPSDLAKHDYITSDNYIQKLQEMADKGDVGALEHLINIFAQREADKTARDWTASREDTAYQRLMEDLKKAGISPYMLTGANPQVSQASVGSYTGSQMSTRENNENTVNAANSRIGVQAISSILALMGVIVAAML